MLRRALLLYVLLWLSPRPAQAEIERTIASSRVLFGDLIPNVPSDLAKLDLGPAPPAGSSRLFSAGELSAAAHEIGTKLDVSDSVRVVRATKRWSQAELLAFITPRLRDALPTHATLIRVDVPRTLITVTQVQLSRLEFGQLPNRRGQVHTSAMAELSSDGRIEQRLTFPVVLDLEERPKPIEIERGMSVVLTINLGSAKVSTAAVTLQPMAVGSTALFRVVKTRKTIRARLLSPSTAEVVSE
jgi:hypothetical protein